MKNKQPAAIPRPGANRRTMVSAVWFFFISLVAKLKSGLAAHRLIFKSGGCWYHRGSLACDEIKISCPSSERYG